MKTRKYKAYYGPEIIPELQGKAACVLTDTGNGFKVKFPSNHSYKQDIFMSLDYSQAAYLKEALNQWDDKNE